MKKVVTNSAIAINDGIAGSRNVVVECLISHVQEKNNGDKIAVYKYIDQSTGDVLKEDRFIIPSADVQAMVDTFKAGLPTVDTWNDMLWAAYCEGAKIEMVSTFAGLTAVSELSTVAL